MTTTVQFAALEAGVGGGESILVVSPTSTGKTQIATWGLANGIQAGCTTVYLVTHRALAKQKFADFKVQLLPTLLENDQSSLVIATGDLIEDANNELPSDPLNSRLLVATYEKYLAMLSASGIPKDMSNTVIVCDEIQLIGDKYRGQSVEVLLTLLKTAGWRQFVGLSAVLQSSDAEMLANWLGIKLVKQVIREKHLNYECWGQNSIASCSTALPDEIVENRPLPPNTESNALSIVSHLLKHESPPTPIIVFCMKKQDTYDLAKLFVEKYISPSSPQLSLAFEELPETSANQFLSGIIEHRIGSHSADLTDEERNIIETQLIENKLDVVFATSTLGAGVNFPLGAAVFSSWKRWDGDKRQHIPIDAAEFHNMSGRVGRMGFEHEVGRVIFTAITPIDKMLAGHYLNLSTLPALQSRVYPSGFEQLSLQLIASGLCNSVATISDLICGTLSGLREADNNLNNFKNWPSCIQTAVDQLATKGMLIKTGSGLLITTEIGKATAFSGLQPNTGINLLEYCTKKIDVFIDCLNNRDEKTLAFLIFSACFSSQEFTAQDGKQPTRFLPYPLGTYLFDPSNHAPNLYEPVWQANIPAINGAKISLDWISGFEIRALEQYLPNLTAGMLSEMFRNLIWVMQGLSTIIMSAVDTRVPISSRPSFLQNNDDLLKKLRKLPRTIRRLSYRLNEGLPDDVLWMTAISKVKSTQNFKINRNEILKFKELNITSSEILCLGNSELDAIRLSVFNKIKPSPHQKANWLRDACRQWKTLQRKDAATRHINKAKQCGLGLLFESYYSSLGDNFEVSLENLLKALGILFEKIDDKQKTGAPDYLLKIKNSPKLVLELKSKKGDKLVDYNGATEVLAASEIHGHGDAFCCTLCHPGVDPSVAPVITNCGRLSVVESHDLGEALLRLAIGVITQEQLWHWLATPGQALMDDLPYRDNTV
ncbi:DEAD/DEAH box helicase [Shewanella sp. SM32]|uniref:DEAD/DEAH box helicase n=2 Tax=Shewanella TaxID=22 RepID=UPI0021D92AFC|nr:DEAD/DEAH box helicase [Shewanella sp. SM32]MCU8071207.1 DEAD/DEAH box helicase [Shewanella sp. SM32]